MTKFNDLSGQEFVTDYGYKFKVLRFVETRGHNAYFEIEFEDTKHKRIVSRESIKRNKLRDTIYEENKKLEELKKITFMANDGYPYKVVRFDHRDDKNAYYEIEFINSGSKKVSCIKEIRNGQVRDDLYDRHVGNTYTNAAGLGYKVLQFYEAGTRFKRERGYKVRFLDSGNEVMIPVSSINNGQFKDHLAITVHGVGSYGYPREFTKREYGVWRGMLHRCYDPHAGNYMNYGAKGVTVCERWHRFDYFLEDLPYIEGYNKILFENGMIQLDKDYKQLYNQPSEKVYSLETCTFLLPEENMYIVNNNCLPSLQKAMIRVRK